MYNRCACTPPPPMILHNLFFYKAFLKLFKIKEGPQSISIAKVDFGAIFKMAASENIIYLREAKLVSKQSHQSPQKEDETILTCIHVQYICSRSMLLNKTAAIIHTNNQT